MIVLPSWVRVAIDCTIDDLRANHRIPARFEATIIERASRAICAVRAIKGRLPDDERLERSIARVALGTVAEGRGAERVVVQMREAETC